jgi:hypothetical protein
MSSFSKSLRRDLKIFLGVSPVLSAISWRVNSLLSFRAFMTSWSVLFSLTMALMFPFVVCVLWFAGVFQFCGKPMRKREYFLLCGYLPPLFIVEVFVS